VHHTLDLVERGIARMRNSRRRIAPSLRPAWRPLNSALAQCARRARRRSALPRRPPPGRLAEPRGRSPTGPPAWPLVPAGIALPVLPACAHLGCVIPPRIARMPPLPRCCRASALRAAESCGLFPAATEKGGFGLVFPRLQRSGQSVPHLRAALPERAPSDIPCLRPAGASLCRAEII
jgi:hypothetical protein